MERHLNIINEIDDLIFEIDEEGSILFANPAAAFFFDKESGDISGLNIFHHITSNCQDEVKRFIHEQNGTARFEYEISDSDGFKTWMGTKVLIQGERDSKRITFISRDIYGRKSYERNLKEVIDSLKILTHNLEVAVLYTDTEDKVLYANEGFCQLFNLDCSSDALKETTIDLSHELFSASLEDPAQFSKTVSRYNKALKKRMGDRVRFKSGKVFEQDFIPVKEQGQYSGNIWIFREITEKVSFEEKFRVIYQNSFIPIMLIDKTGVTDANNAALKLLEAESISQIEGVHPSKFSPELQPNGKPSLKEARKVNRLIESRGSCKFSWVHKSLNGNEFEVEATSSYLKIDGKKLEILMWQDVSQNKLQERRLIEKQSELEAFVGAAPAAIAMFDKNMNYVAASERWLDDYKLKGIELKGKNHYELFPDIPKHWKLIHKRGMKGAIESEEEDKAYHKDGTFDWIRWEVRPWFNVDYEIAGIVIMTEIITEQKRQEEELRLAKQKAEEASNAKALFLSAMSHEIRTPMNAVIGMSHLLLQSDPRPDQIEDLKTLQFAANNLLALINDILDFNKIEAGKVTLEATQFDLSEQIRGIIQSLSFKAHEKSLLLEHEISNDLPRRFIGDPVRIGQILTNLIGNAIKFTEKGYVRLCVSKLKQHKGKCEVLFSVEDTGIGISPEKYDLIFDMFSQAEKNTTRRFGGTGLGLAISKKLVELQGGEIRVESELGKGSVFSFNLNLKIAKNQDSKTEKSSISKMPEKDLKGIKVLLVEDNATNKLVAKKFLEMWNARVSYAENGLEALKKVKEDNFDIVLMDLQMPVMDGYVATEKIRELEGDKSKVPIAALTASAMLEIKDRAFEVGMNEYISKPFMPDELFSKIEMLVKNKKAADPEVKMEKETGLEEQVKSSYKFQKIEKLARGDAQFINELIDSYSESFKEFLKNVEEQIETGDQEGIKKSTHKVKASVTFLEAKDIEESIGQLKEVALSGDNSKSGVQNILHELRSKVENTLADMNRKKLN